MAIIYLTGARGSGKTTVGAALARELACPFVDLDAWLVEREGKNVEQIVSEYGWSGFRQKESQALIDATSHLLGAAHAVVATGGGIVLAPANRKYMRENGIVVWLKGEPGLLEARIAKTPLHAQRPSLTGKGALEEIREVCAEREPLYLECASHVIEAAMPARRICSLIRNVCRL